MNVRPFARGTPCLPFSGRNWVVQWLERDRRWTVKWSDSFDGWATIGCRVVRSVIVVFVGEGGWGGACLSKDSVAYHSAHKIFVNDITVLKKVLFLM